MLTPTDMPYVGGFDYFVQPDGQAVITIVVPIAEDEMLQIGIAGADAQLLAPDATGAVVATLYPTTDELYEAAGVEMAYVNDFGSGPALSIPVTTFVY